MVIIVIAVLFIAIALAISSSSPAPIVIPLKQHKIISPKRVRLTHINTDNIFERRQKSTLFLDDDIQDGLDTVYYGTVTIGTPAKEYKMIFDTGSADTWIIGWSEELKTYIFNPRDSDTAVRQGREENFKYGDGTMVSVDMWFENVTMAGLNVYDQDLGVTLRHTNPKLLGPYQGILGMAYSYESESRSTTFLETLVKRNFVSSASFGFYFARESKGERGSHLTIGGFDQRLAQIPNYNKVIPGKSWTIILNGIRVNNDLKGRRRTALIDTGTTLIYAPISDALEVFYAIPERSVLPHGNQLAVSFPCQVPFTINFVFNNVDYLMSRHDLILNKKGSRCLGSIVGHDKHKSSYQIGIAFLKNVYTIFDLKNNRIGFTSLTMSLKDGSSSSDT